VHPQTNTIIAKAHAKSVLARYRPTPAWLNAMDACSYTAPVTLVARYFAVEPYAHG